MKLLVDPEIFFYGRCGLVRYYSSVIKRLRERGVAVELPLIASGSDFIAGRFPLVQPPVRHGQRSFLRLRVGNRLSKRWYLRRVRHGDYDCLLPTSPRFEDDFLSCLPADKPYMMVVHDTMRCVNGPDGLFDATGHNADRLAYLVGRASATICISHRTRRDLEQLVPRAASRLHVVHTGNLLQASVSSADGLPSSDAALAERYLLFVGERTGRKNFRFTLQSIAEWLKRRTDIRLVCTGRSNKWEQDFLDHLGIRDRVLFLEATDEQLVSLYRQAVALLYPSLYEGFGLPVLEAMSLGCPVVTSRCGAIPEVAGEAVLYADPLDGMSIAEAVRTIVEDRVLAARLAEAGRSRARRFTLESMMDRFETVLNIVHRREEA